MDTQTVIADVDTGVDDALALLVLARHPRVDLRGVTCVAGNTSVEQVAANTASVLALAGRADVPIGIGADRPLRAPARHAQGFHGADGLGGIALPRVPPPRDLTAIDLMTRVIEECPDRVTVIALAPLTNIATFITLRPDLLSRIERVVMMGGAICGGNATAVAEFNVWHDPEAADIVLRAGVPVVMYGLDVFEQAIVPADRVSALTKVAQDDTDDLRRFARALLRHLEIPSGDRAVVGADDSLVGDAGAVAAAIDDRLIRVKNYPVAIALAPGITRGQTVVDRRGRAGEQEQHSEQQPWPVIAVATSVDSAGVADLILATLTQGSTGRPS